MSEYGVGSAEGRASDVGQDVEYRLSRQYRRPMGNRFAMLAALTVICVITRNSTLEVAAYATGALAAVFGVLYLWQGRFATKVTGRGIEVRGYFNHFVPWNDIRGIDVTRLGGGALRLDQDLGSQNVARPYIPSANNRSLVRTRRVSPNGMAHLDSINLVRVSGGTLRLRAPAVTGWASDPDFSDKARQLEQLCSRYGRGSIS